MNVTSTDDAPALAAVIKEANKRGIEVVPVITPGNLSLDKDTPDALYEKAHTLATELGTQFKDDVRTWELGNEMENYAIIKACEKRDDGSQYPCAWGPAGGVSALDYYGPRWAKVSAVLKGLSEGMTAVDPEIRKAMGTAGWGHLGAFERMKADGINWDITVWHMYGEDPETAFQKLARYGHPIWVTEFNNSGGSKVSDKEQAEGLRKAMDRLSQLELRYNVEAAHIYELIDETYWTPSAEAYMGLVRLDKDGDGWTVGEPKPAYFVVRDTIRGPRPTPMPDRDCDMTGGSEGTVVARQIDAAYCTVLGREPTEEEVTNETAWLNDGQSATAMVLNLMRSPEFNKRYTVFGMSNRTFQLHVPGAAQPRGRPLRPGQLRQPGDQGLDQALRRGRRDHGLGGIPQQASGLVRKQGCHDRHRQDQVCGLNTVARVR